VRPIWWRCSRNCDEHQGDAENVLHLLCAPRLWLFGRPLDLIGIYLGLENDTSGPRIETPE